MAKVVLVCCSDIHLSDKAPAWRSAEPDWHAAMARPLQELRCLTKLHHCPLVVAGDIFDRFDPSPALINFALTHLPFCYAVPGQHDLPHHNYQDIKKSAYWTLAEAGRVADLRPGHPRGVQGARFYAFPWNHPLAPNDEPRPLDGLAVAVIHKYVWTERCSYPGAPASNRLAELRKQLAGYDVAIFGDNHKGFSSHKENSCTVINCGGFMRRKSDERDYRPRAWLVYDDGHAEPHELDTSEDRHVERADPEELPGLGLPQEGQGGPNTHLAEFLDDLGAVSSEPLDFEEAVQEHWRRESGKGGVLALLKEAMR